MKEKITLSVIVPVYNAAAHLEECVRSILEQALQNLELILVDDGSDDGSGEICDAFAKDERVKVIHKQNGGPGEARNCGIKAARGEFIGFVDADDSVSADMYKTLCEAVSSSGADMAFCNYVIKAKNGDSEVRSDLSGGKIYNREDIVRFVLPYFFGYNDSEIASYKDFCPFADYSSYVWLCVYRSSLIKEHNVHFHSQGKYYNEDHMFNLKAIFNSSSIIHVDKCLYFYRDCEDSLTKRYNADFLEAKLNRYTYLRRFIEANGCETSYHRRLDNKICIESINVINYYVNADISLSEKYAKIQKTVNEPVISEALKGLNLKKTPFSKLSVFLRFERRRACLMLLLLSQGYKLIRK